MRGKARRPLLALAAVCGAFWTVERLLSRSLFAPVLTHALWGALVLGALPLERTAP